MIPIAPAGSAKAPGSGRRGEVLRALADAGLARASRRGLHLVAGLESSGRCARLARVLEQLGPVFALFGQYMSTRPDLLAVRDCLELAEIRNPAAPDAAEDWLGGSGYTRWDPAPFAAGCLWQKHRAWLHDGSEVVVKIARALSAAQLADLPLLPLLEPAFTGEPWKSGVFAAAAADFSRTLAERQDLSYEARALESLARDAAEFDILRVPRVRRLAAGNRMLELDALPRGETGPDQLARLIAVSWLRQALGGQVYPVDPCLENIAVVSADRIAFTASEWASLPGDPQSNLREYLLAVQTEDPDKASTFLLKEMANRDQCPREEDLRRAFRQLVPFRHPESSVASGRQHMADHLLLHWRFAGDLGYIPAPHLHAFYRGLFTLVQVTSALAPQRDAVADAMRDVRLFEGMTQFRNMLTPAQMGDLLDKYAAAFLELPQRLDKFLTIGADGAAQIRVSLAENPAARREKNSGAIRNALCIVAAALLMAGRAAAQQMGGVWASRLETVAFGLMGALLLWVVVRAK